MSNSYTSILPIFNSINFPTPTEFLTQNTANALYLAKTGGTVNSLSVLNSFKVNSNGTPFTNVQFGTYTNLNSTSINANSSINVSITFPSAFSIGSTPKVIVCNSTSATQGTITALQNLLVSAQQVNISGFSLNISNVGNTNFNGFLNVDWVVFRDT